jgi:hypothetical protein
LVFDESHGAADLSASLDNLGLDAMIVLVFPECTEIEGVAHLDVSCYLIDLTALFSHSSSSRIRPGSLVFGVDTIDISGDQLDASSALP